MKRKPRFYYPENLNINECITLTSNQHIHITKVLRMQIHDEIILFDGNEKEYLATLESITKKTTAKITQKLNTSLESPLNIHLAQGLARGDRMDTIIQKATELGVHRITPLISDNSLIKLDQKRSEKKLQHWQNIIISAAEQCGRTVLPTIDPPILFKKFINIPCSGTKVFFHPEATQSITHLTTQNQPLQVLIGPESGFSDAEYELALKQNVQGYRLGPRILRTETASIAALSILQALHGDLQ